MQQTFHNVRARIRAACADADRDPGEVRLLAVGKAQPASSLRALYALGQRAFGENYLDEARAKQEALADLDLEWYFIGPVQSNKTRALAAHFDWVQSADRMKIVRRLGDQRPAEKPPLNVCLQVNIDDEAQKAGCRPEHLPALADTVAGCDRLRLRGLMAIPAPVATYDAQLASFRRIAELYHALRRTHPDIDTLSIGMSDDLEAAIAAGSTMVRVGTALFGSRARTSPGGQSG